MTPLSSVCERSSSLLHAATYEHGQMIRVGGSRLLSVCRHCGKGIERAHRHSKFWVATPDIPIGEDHEDSLSLSDESDESPK